MTTTPDTERRERWEDAMAGAIANPRLIKSAATEAMHMADQELAAAARDTDTACEDGAHLEADNARLRKEAAEVRAAALTDAAGALEAHCHRHGDGEATFADCLCAAAHELRRMAAAARPDNTEGA